MRKKFSNQYRDHLIEFLKCESEGQLINITKVYDDYGKPSNKSPRRVLKQEYFLHKLQELAEEKEYEIEKVIRYSGKDVYVTYELAHHYLTEIDVENYRKLIAYMCKNGFMKLCEEIPFINFNKANHNGIDYSNLSF